PGGEDLRQMLFGDDASVAIEGDAFFNLDAEVPGPGAALLQGLQQFRMGGNSGAAADQFDRRALIDLGAPADLPQERRTEEARHRAADDDRPPGWAVCSHPLISVPPFSVLLQSYQTTDAQAFFNRLRLSR